MIDNEATLIATTFEWADQIDLSRAERAQRDGKSPHRSGGKRSSRAHARGGQAQAGAGAHQREGMTPA